MIPDTAHAMPEEQTARPATAAPFAAASKLSHFVTAGEKKFDRRNYTGIGYFANALLSVAAVYAVERTPKGQQMIEKFGEWVGKSFKVSAERAKFIARKSFFLSGGFAVLVPMKWMEDDKPTLIKKWNHEIYGAKAETDPAIVQSQHEVEQGPKQSWASIFSSRVLALIPFYITVGMLWDRKSMLAKATNPELRAMSKDAIKTMEETNPSGFSQIANKGAYFDRPIASVSRTLGKGWAKLTGDTAAVAKLTEMEAKYPGMIKQGAVGSADRDTIHSSMPYYFISEAITSAMVAWGVYVLTRVTGPFFDHKHKAQPATSIPLDSPLGDFQKTLIDTVHQTPGRGSAVLDKALAHGVTIIGFVPEATQADIGGYYDEKTNRLYINTQRPLAHQVQILVQEAQHACNLLEGLVQSKDAAHALGLANYTDNFLRDEARAHATGFIFAHEANATKELQEATMQHLFHDMPYEGANEEAFQRYTEHALAHLKQDVLGYLSNAKESYLAQMAHAKKQEHPTTQIQVSDVQHQPAAMAMPELAGAR